MSQAAIERGGSSWIDRLDQSVAAKAKNLELGRKAQIPSVTPEAPRLHVPAILSDERGSVRFGLPVSITLATLAGAGMLAIARDRGPSAPPQDNAPISDTIKPPEGGQPAVSLSPPEPPKKNPMEQALESGKIDLGSSKNIQDYFQPVSKTEAPNNSTPEFPINPQKNPNLKVANEVLNGSTGQSFNFLVLDNVENNQPVRATEAGTFRISNVGGPPDNYKLARIEIGTKKYFFYIKEAKIPDHFIWGETYSVNAGDILFSIINTTSPLSDQFHNHQIAVRMEGVNNLDSPLANFVDPVTGKIPFIDDSV